RERRAASGRAGGLRTAPQRSWRPRRRSAPPPPTGPAPPPPPPTPLPPAPPDADLLFDLALGGFPCRLSGLNPAARQGDLPRMVPEVGPASHERHHPAPALPIEHEDDG